MNISLTRLEALAAYDTRPEVTAARELVQSVQRVVPSDASIEQLTPLRKRINEASLRINALERDAHLAEDAVVREGVAAARTQLVYG